MKEYLTRSPEETKRLARKIAGVLKNHDLLGFIGELGAGKTCFIQGLAEGLNVPKNFYVSSPTFTIMKMYSGDMNIHHFDFYRLTDAQEFEDLGFDDYLKCDGITVVEWADHFMELLPKDIIKLQFKVVSENERSILIPSELIKRMEAK